jgi:hypothetical protein
LAALLAIPVLVVGGYVLVGYRNIKRDGHPDIV